MIYKYRVQDKLERDAKVIAMYGKGMLTKLIMHTVKIGSPATFYNILHRHGVVCGRPGRKVTQRDLFS